MAEQVGSPLEGRQMAQILVCRFLEALVEDFNNPETFQIIAWQLKEKATLENVTDSLQQWPDLVEDLESSSDRTTGC